MALWQHQLDGAEFVDGKRGALLWWGMGCLAGETILKIKRNGIEMSFAFKELYTEFNSKNKYKIKTLIDGKLQWSEIDSVSYSGIKKLIKIKFESKNSIECTLDHRLMMTNGQWREAGRLLINDSIYTTYREDKVIAIYKINNRPTYDITMKHSNNFVANQIIVHNSGKTYGTIHIIKEQNAEIILIVCPKSVITTWIKEIEKHASGQFVVIAPTKGSVSKKATQIRQAISYYKGKGKPLVIIVNYESVWRPGLGQIRDKHKNIRDNGLLKSITWDMIVADECFIKGTLIDTPDGFVKIQNLKKGDAVYGYDHEVERVIETKIISIMENDVTLIKLCKFNNSVVTKMHPIYTQLGYKPVKNLTGSDILFLRTANNNINKISFDKLQQKTNKKVKAKTINTVYNFETGTNN